MFWRKISLIVVILTFTSPSIKAFEFGRSAKPDEIALWDIDVGPDGRGLPVGSGTVLQGKSVYEQNCAVCHGEGGQGGFKDRLAGGQGTLTSAKPIKTVGSFWPYATTLFDYVRRAMPYPAPGSLSADETYAVTAYILELNGIIGGNATLSNKNLTQIRMPNRDGFVPDVDSTNIHNSR